MIYIRSVTVQRHRQSGNLKVWPTKWTNKLSGVGATAAKASKTLCEGWFHWPTSVIFKSGSKSPWSSVNYATQWKVAMTTYHPIPSASICFRNIHVGKSQNISRKSLKACRQWKWRHEKVSFSANSSNNFSKCWKVLNSARKSENENTYN